MLYYRILNNTLVDWASYKYSDDCKKTDIVESDFLEKHPNYVIVINGELALNPNYEREEEEKKEAEFNREFFNTSLGYVRRKVTMKDGSVKDFLSDILPLLAVGVPVLTYTKELVQNKVIVTEQFINECKQQMLKDFYGG